MNATTAAALVRRFSALAPTATALWGNMSVEEMLYHCAVVNSAIISSKPSGKAPTLKQRVLKFMVLRVVQRLPQGAPTNPLFLRQGAQVLDFETEKQRLLGSIAEFADYSGPLLGTHPVFGTLTTEEWRTFVLIHLKHHLKQFRG